MCCPYFPTAAKPLILTLFLAIVVLHFNVCEPLNQEAHNKIDNGRLLTDPSDGLVESVSDSSRGVRGGRVEERISPENVTWISSRPRRLRTQDGIQTRTNVNSNRILTVLLGKLIQYVAVQLFGGNCGAIVV